MQNDWKLRNVGREALGLYHWVGFGLPQAFLAWCFLAAFVACAPSHRLTPTQCAVIGAGLGVVGGGAGGAEYANENSTAAGVGIGVAGTVAGAALGWGLCRLLQPAVVSELEPGVEPEPEPSPQPIPEPKPAPPPIPEPEPKPELEPAPSKEPPPPPPAQPGPCAGTIELPVLRFALGQSVIRLESFDILDRALERLVMCDDEHVQVEGHSDSTGPDALNQQLARDRAEAVRTYLVEAGIDEERVMARGLGGQRPIASNDTVEGRAQNRRVEIHFVEAPPE